MTNITDTVDKAASVAAEYVGSNPEDVTTNDRLYILKAYALYDTLKAKTSLLEKTVFDLQHFSHFNVTTKHCFTQYAKEAAQFRAMLDYTTPINAKANNGADITVSWIHLMERHVTDYKTAVMQHLAVTYDRCPADVKPLDNTDATDALMFINEVVCILSDMLELVYAIHYNVRRVMGDMPQNSTRCILDYSDETPSMEVTESLEAIYSIVPSYEYVSIMDNHSNVVDSLIDFNLKVNGSRKV